MLCRDDPTLRYQPHAHGQEQFHRSTHPIRLCVPGNGWGKTMAAGIEVAWWLSHTHRYQPSRPLPVSVLWVAPEYRQFDMVARALLETKCLPVGWRWNDQKKMYTYPSGDRMYIMSTDRDWTYIQGVPLDLVVFDEEPPIGLWRELRQRRRADRKTRFVVVATATNGSSWMEEELYLPWLKSHADKGLDERGAMQAQLDKYIWCWPRGGIKDNPAADAEDLEWYQQGKWSSDAERNVRLDGGFADFSGLPVFDLDALSGMLALATDSPRHGLALA